MKFFRPPSKSSKPSPIVYQPSSIVTRDAGAIITLDSGSSIIDRKSKVKYTPQSGVSYQRDNYGKGYNLGATTTGIQSNATSTDAAASESHAITIVTKLASVGAVNNWFFEVMQGSSTVDVAIYLWWSNLDLASLGFNNIVHGWVNSGFQDHTISWTPQADRVYVITSTHDAVNSLIHLWVDGKEIGTVSTTTDPDTASFTDNNVILGRVVANGGATTNYLSMYHRRYMRPKEVVSLHRNIWANLSAPYTSNISVAAPVGFVPKGIFDKPLNRPLRGPM